MEKYNNEVAELAGVAIPNIIFTDEGIKLTPYYSSIEKIDRDMLKNTSNLKKIGNLFRTLYHIETPFHNQFDYWTEVERYKSVLGEIPLVYSDYESRILNLTSNETTQFVPCHIDPLPENFIPDSKGNLYLIDWEYSANYLPEWDIAGYALESELTEEEERILIEAYADESLTLEKVALQKIKQDYLWSLWGLIKLKNDDRFEEYVQKRTNRLQENLENLDWELL